MKPSVNGRARRSLLVIGGAVGAAAFSGIVGASVQPARSIPDASSTPRVAPLASSISVANDTWATVAMGHLNDPENTFWELFVRSSGDGKWSLVTPPGVADNGGLVLAPPNGPAGIIVGFRPSQLLHFSPLAGSIDLGQTWSPGTLPSGLVDQPDALASRAGSPDLLALTNASSKQVLTATRGLSVWTTIANEKTIGTSSVGRTCGVTDLRGVGFAPDGSVLVGASCRRPDVAGVFAKQAGTWTLAGPHLPPSLRNDLVSVQRLVSDTAGVTTLFELRDETASSLLAGSLQHGQWRLSPPLALLGEQAVSTATAPNSGLAVELRNAAGHETLWSTSNANRSWRKYPALPRGTATVAFAPNGAMEALVVSSATLTSWQLAAGAKRWAKVQTLQVPIPYGSSG